MKSEKQKLKVDNEYVILFNATICSHNKFYFLLLLVVFLFQEKEDDTSFLSEEGRTNTLYEDPLLATPKSENNMLYHLVPKEVK